MIHKDLIKNLKGSDEYKKLVYEQEKERVKLPHYIRYEGFDGHICINWFSEINGDLVEINTIITDRTLINEFLNVTSERQNYPGGYRIINTHLEKKGNFKDWDYITWARGSENYQNDFTLYGKPEEDFKKLLNG